MDVKDPINLRAECVSARVNPRRFLQELYLSAIRRAQPIHCIAPYLPPQPRGRTVVIGAGKAAGAMAHAVDELWSKNAPLSGMVITRYHHTPPVPSGWKPRIQVVEAAHPVPDAAGVRATQQILAAVQNLTADDLVLCLISGGGSALLTAPAAPLTLQEKQNITAALLASGATISEMNCVRKHLSRVKGGRLAAACSPAQVVTLAISDVPGDDPSMIASGPTVADPTSCNDALDILDRYGISLPAAMKSLLRHGELETPKPWDSSFCRHELHMIATPRDALEAAADRARAAGLEAYILSDELEGESREVGKVHGALARAVAMRGEPFRKPCVLLSGGETTVTVRKRADPSELGRGGRAGEFCLGLTQALQGQPNVFALAADTDGIDGVEDNAGAFVFPDTIRRAQKDGRRTEDYMARHDSYSYFHALGDLLVTGPTHTNVNDFRAILIL